MLAAATFLVVQMRVFFGSEPFYNHTNVDGNIVRHIYILRGKGRSFYVCAQRIFI